MERRLRILALEPYATRSHRSFLEGLARHSRHRLVSASLGAHHWKWRMRTAALAFAPRVLEGDEGGEPFDLLLASDYLNLAELSALLPPGRTLPPSVLYFHENQLTYPLQEGERRDVHFALTHFYAMQAARASLFNSSYHRETFLGALEALLRRAPDVDVEPALAVARERSRVLPLGLDLEAGEPRPPAPEGPLVLWPHRWEYDKDPEAFAAACRTLDEEGTPFRLALLGKQNQRAHPALEALAQDLAPRVSVAGFLPSRAEYRELLDQADVVVSTARHEFFGLATLEAVRRGALPVLPNDLAYPELLPGALRREPFLYPREEGLLPALRRALAGVQEGSWMEERSALAASTERFHWSALAPRFDACFEAAAR